MVITHHGDNFFRLQVGNFTLVVDPTNDRMKPDLTLKTLSSPEVPDITEAGNLIDSPGEFDISGVAVKGFGIDSESTAKFVKTVFSVSGLDDLRLCFLGHLSGILDSDIAAKIGAVDILFLPIGTPHFLSCENALKLLKVIEPKVVIPSFSEATFAAEFTKTLGQESEQLDKLVLKPKDLPEKGMRVVILKNE